VNGLSGGMGKPGNVRSGSRRDGVDGSCMKDMLQFIGVPVVGQEAKRTNVQRVEPNVVLTIRKSFIPVFGTG
jgi:hypothetical protein